MTARSALPPGLGAAFRVDTARAAGVSRGRLGARDLTAPTRGARAVVGADHDERLAAVLAALRPDAFGMGRTAARWYGLPLPAPASGDPAAGFDIGVPRGVRAPRRAGVRGRSVDIDDGELVTVAPGLRLTSPARTWFDLGSELGLADLVAVGDALLRPPHERLNRDELRTVLAAHPRGPGSARARQALPLLSSRAESPQESRLRILLHLAGLPSTEVNVSLFDGRRFVARVDLLFREYGVAVEYEGGHHGADPTQWRRDISRIGAVQALGIIVERVHADDLRQPRALLDRLAIHLRRRGWTGAHLVP